MKFWILKFFEITDVVSDLAEIKMNKNLLSKERSIIEYRCLIWWILYYFSNNLLIIISKIGYTRKYISKKIKKGFENVAY